MTHSSSYFVSGSVDLLSATNIDYPQQGVEKVVGFCEERPYKLRDPESESSFDGDSSRWESGVTVIKGTSSFSLNNDSSVSTGEEPDAWSESESFDYEDSFGDFAAAKRFHAPDLAYRLDRQNSLSVTSSQIFPSKSSGV